MQKKSHYALIVTGLGNDHSIVNHLTQPWQKHRITTGIHKIHWDKNAHFSEQLSDLLEVIDQLHQHHVVSLVGISAGVSAVLNAFAERRKHINSVIAVCGRMRENSHVLRSLHRMSSGKPVFFQSVKRFEDSESTLTDQEKARILAFHSAFDELVPPDTATLTGATNVRSYVPEHTLAIYSILAFSHRIPEFILQQSQPA